MDKLKENSQIPVNTRIIGTPGGIYVLYLEDYVHTFIKKLLEESTKKDNLYNSTDGIFFYGNRFEDDKRTILVVSGASDMAYVTSKTEKYFSGITMLGIAKASLNKDLGMRIEITLSSDVKVILDDFYIYYDQNEEMQSYLIEWNLSHHTSFAHMGSIKEYLQRDTDFISNPSEININIEDMAQNNNKDEIKVGFIWNAMNVLSLGFVICATVYGIVSINNYQKMQGIKESVDYCMSVISQNIQPQEEALQIQPSESEKLAEDFSTAETMESTEIIGITESTEVIEEITALEQQDNNSKTEYAVQEEIQTAAPQYYIVRKGDTLRTICIDVYGDYSRVNEVCKYNNIDNPDDILYGQKLLLP